MRISKQHARELIDLLLETWVGGPLGKVATDLATALDKAQAADIDAGDDNTVTIIIKS